MRKIKSLCLFIFLALPIALPAKSHYSQRLDKALDTLDYVISQRKTFISNRAALIDSLKSDVYTLRKGELTMSDFKLIGEAYEGFCVDSATAYYYSGYCEAVEQANKQMQHVFLIDLVGQMAKTPLLARGISIIDSIDVSALDNNTRLKYYNTRATLYINLLQYSVNPSWQALHHKKAVEALENLMACYQRNSTNYQLTASVRYYLCQDTTMAIGELNEAMEHIDRSHPAYAIATSLLANLYKGNPTKQNDYLYYLTLSAITDVKNANTESFSLAMLGGELFRYGDLDRAYNYLTAAGEAVSISGSQVLSADMTSTLLVLAESIKAREATAKKFSFFVALIALFLLVVVFWICIRWKVSKSRYKKSVNAFQAAISQRDLYISQLLDFCSVYADALGDFNKMAGRKLKAGQGQDLLSMIESGKVIQEQNERFFAVFDEAVLHIFPNFVSEVNGLLEEDKQIELGTAKSLTPELRILAFMRLGVSDSVRISKFLGLSLNTIYTYRNRMKTRAKNRDSFDEDIQNIGKIS